MSTKISPASRKEKCHCGSGRQLKHCHYAADRKAEDDAARAAEPRKYLNDRGDWVLVGEEPRGQRGATRRAMMVAALLGAGRHHGRR